MFFTLYITLCILLLSNLSLSFTLSLPNLLKLHFIPSLTYENKQQCKQKVDNLKKKVKRRLFKLWLNQHRNLLPTRADLLINLDPRSMSSSDLIPWDAIQALMKTAPEPRCGAHKLAVTLPGFSRKSLRHLMTQLTSECLSCFIFHFIAYVRNFILSERCRADIGTRLHYTRSINPVNCAI